MMMTIVVYCSIYLSVLVFLIACAVRAIYYARLPLHLQWELYPIHMKSQRERSTGDHISKPRTGGRSPFIPTGWVSGNSCCRRCSFKKPCGSSTGHSGFSFPFHFGLYLLVGSTGLLGVTRRTHSVGAGPDGRPHRIVFSTPTRGVRGRSGDGHGGSP